MVVALTSKRCNYEIERKNMSLYSKEYLKTQLEIQVSKYESMVRVLQEAEASLRTINSEKPNWLVLTSAHALIGELHLHLEKIAWRIGSIQKDLNGMDE